MNKLFKNRKGSLLDLIIWVSITMVVVLFLGLWMFAHNMVTNALVSIPTTNNVNISGAATQTFGVMDTAEQFWLPLLAFIILVCEGLSILVTSFYVKEHPIMFVPYILIVIVGIALSVLISNAYEGLLTGNVFSASLQSMTAATFIMLHLPLWTAVLGIFGLILLLAGIIVDKDSGGSVNV